MKQLYFRLLYFVRPFEKGLPQYLTIWFLLELAHSEFNTREFGLKWYAMSFVIIMAHSAYIQPAIDRLYYEYKNP